MYYLLFFLRFGDELNDIRLYKSVLDGLFFRFNNSLSIRIKVLLFVFIMYFVGMILVCIKMEKY